MKESILDVLLYLFEHHFEAGEGPLIDRIAPIKDEPLYTELQHAGFSPAEIRSAFDWLDGLERQRHVADVRMPLFMQRQFRPTDNLG